MSLMHVRLAADNFMQASDANLYIVLMHQSAAQTGGYS